MRAAQVVWAELPARPRKARGHWSKDLYVVAVVCVIFGLEIVAVMQTAGGPDAYRMVAAEGMQQAE